MNNYDSKWILVRTKHGPVKVEAQLLRTIEGCRKKGIKKLVMPTLSAYYDAFRFSWTSPLEPTERELKLMSAVTAGVEIQTMNDPAAGRDSDMEFERKMGEDQNAAMTEKIKEQGGVPIVIT